MQAYLDASRSESGNIEYSIHCLTPYQLALVQSALLDYTLECNRQRDECLQHFAVTGSPDSVTHALECITDSCNALALGRCIAVERTE